MKSFWMKYFAIGALLGVGSAHAIFGIGGHYAPNLTTQVDGSNEIAYQASPGNNSNNVSLGFDRMSVSGMQGLGIKIWIDALPFIDIEAATNLQFTRYDMDAILSGGSFDSTIALTVETPLPFLSEASPAYGRITSDLTVKYPFLKFPPAVSILKIYAGGGLSHVIGTAVLNKDIVEQAAKEVFENNSNPPDLSTDAGQTRAVQELTESLSKALVDEGLQSGVGFHLLVGAKAKLPVIPIAAYLDAKYHFLSGLPESVSPSSLTLELGGAFAF